MRREKRTPREPGVWSGKAMGIRHYDLSHRFLSLRGNRAQSHRTEAQHLLPTGCPFHRLKERISDCYFKVWKLLELGGTEMMHHRAAARPRTQVERVKRQTEAWQVTAAGTGGKWLRKTTGATQA